MNSRKMDKRELENRSKIIRVLDENAAWTHVAMRYATCMVREHLRTRKDGFRLDRRDNQARIVIDLNHALGDIVDIDNILKMRKANNA